MERRRLGLIWLSGLVAVVGCSACESKTATPPPTSRPACAFSVPDPEGHFGSGDLWVTLYAGRTPTEAAPSGGFSVKFGWQRGKPGQLEVTATRIDGPGTALVEIPRFYGDYGMQPMNVTFSDLGCWRLTGTVADVTLTAVVELAPPR